MEGDNTVVTESEAPRVLLPDIVQGDGNFKFPNGDHYVGGYEAKKANLTVTKNGKKITVLKICNGYGEYTTWDGHVYKANWINDQLNPSEEIIIDFCDSSKYHGSIENGQYSGWGTYSFPDKSSIQCIFKENQPTGDVMFADKQDVSWIGGYLNNNVKLLRMNIFHSSCPRRTVVESIPDEIEEMNNDK